jgi:hypothetical protein
MKRYEILVLLVLECISLVLIVALWRSKRRMPVWQRCVWSALLLVPLVGWILYGFIATDPEAHSDDLPARFE